MDDKYLSESERLKWLADHENDDEWVPEFIRVSHEHVSALEPLAPRGAIELEPETHRDDLNETLLLRESAESYRTHGAMREPDGISYALLLIVIAAVCAFILIIV